MYLCSECGLLFEEGEQRVLYENQGECHGFPAFERWEVCPSCGGGFTEAAECCNCDRVLSGSELHGLINGFCEECLREQITIESLYSFCKDIKNIQEAVYQDLLDSCRDVVINDFSCAEMFADWLNGKEIKK